MSVEVKKTNHKKKLVIVESPAKAKTIGKYLGKNYKVIASQGHVRDLPKSQLGIEPENDFSMKYITIRGRGDILASIRKEAKEASFVYLATDPDREGEAISWHLASILGINENEYCRIEFNEVTKKAVQKAIQNPRQLDMDRIDAQQARRALDRLVGYKISPLLWAKVKKGLSAGRVQSVATKMVVNRENEINSFEPVEYWDIAASCAYNDKKSFNARLYTQNGDKVKISCKEEAESAVELIKNDHFFVQEIRKGEKKKFPSAPFTTSSLQQEAGRKLNFTTARTMQVVQQLYEGIEIEHEGAQGLVTYIRTDSVRVSEEALDEARSYIPKQYGKEYLPETPNEYKGRKNAQDAHEAIRPTSIERTPESIRSSLTKEQYQLYRLIYLRFVASQMSPAVYETMNAEITGNKSTLRFYGERKTFPGYTLIYEESSDDTQVDPESVFPNITEGMDININDVISEQHFTQPPSHFTEASLVKAMEEKGIGRPSTYAPTITTIISRGYVSREKKKLYPTELGSMITSMMEEWFSEIIDLDFTAEMENKLDEVEEGNLEWKEILRQFYFDFTEKLKKAETAIDKVQIQDEVSDIVCNQCGALMVYKMGRYGKFLACPNFPSCRNTMPILSYIDVPCPKCGKRLMEKISKKNRKFYGCEAYPQCDFVSWDKPVTEKCPKCGYWMVEKHAGNKLQHACMNENCKTRIDISLTSEDNDHE